MSSSDADAPEGVTDEASPDEPTEAAAEEPAEAQAAPTEGTEAEPAEAEAPAAEAEAPETEAAAATEAEAGGDEPAAATEAGAPAAEAEPAEAPEAEAPEAEAPDAVAAEAGAGGDEPAEEVLDDPARQALIDELRAELGDDLADVALDPTRDVWVRVATDAWKRAGQVARDRLGLNYFCFLSIIDWLPSPFGRSMDAEVDKVLAGEDRAREPDVLAHGITGGDTRFQVFARLYSIERRLGMTLKADVPDETGTVESWSSLYAGANWHEREAWEMYGIRFDGHPNLRNLYLPGAFEGHPQRKDFPLLSRIVKPWPGIVDVEGMPGVADDEGAE